MTERRARRLGLTMRVVPAESYDEPRDALAQAWRDYLAFALPEAHWVPVPNLESEVIGFAARFELDGLVLTGGDDPGVTPGRDRTEIELIEYFQAERLPVFAVCRGLQLFNLHLGGGLERCDPAGSHVAVRHTVRTVEAIAGDDTGNEREVNSYHDLSIPAAQLAGSLRPFAVTDGGATIEGAWTAVPRFVGVMWHPERDPPFSDDDRRLFRWTFGYAGSGP